MGDSCVQMNYIPPSRNMARRGRFPSRMNTIPMPNRYSITTDKCRPNKEGINVFISDSQNSNTDSQKETLSSGSDLSVSRRSSTYQKKGGVNKSFSSRNCQKTTTKSKSPFFNSKNQTDAPPLKIKTNLKSVDFDKQLEFFLSETSKGRCSVPFSIDDVIPATPERTLQRLSSTIKLKGGVAVIKKSSNILSNTEISFNGAIKKAGGDIGSENVARQSQTPVKEKCAILEKFETVSNRLKNLITTCLEETCNGNAEIKECDKNIEENIVCEVQFPEESQTKYIKPKTVTDLDIEQSSHIESRDNIGEQGQMSQKDMTMVQEPMVSDKRVLRKTVRVAKAKPSIRTVSSQKDTLLIKVNESNDVCIKKSNKNKKAAKNTTEVKQNVKENKKNKNISAGRNTTTVNKKQETATNRRVLSRKGRGVSRECDDCGEAFASRTVSSTSLLSKMSTRSQSAASLEKPHNNKSFLDKTAIDEFFDKNCTKNDGNPTIDPLIIRKMNASSSDDTDAEEDKSRDREISEPVNHSQSSKTSINIQHANDPSKISSTKLQKQLRVSLSKSPQIESLIENQQVVPDKIDLKDYVEIDLQSPSKCSNNSRKRRLYSGKFDNKFSESESPKKVKTPDKSLKRASTESAQIYINIENERKKANTSGDGRARTTKQQKLASKKDKIKHVQVPKNTKPSLNANFSYRRFSNEHNDQHKNDIFEMATKNQGKNVYSDFEDSSSDSEKVTSKRRKAAQKKPYKTKIKQPKKNSSIENIVENENRLIDEKIRSVTSKQPSLDNYSNLFKMDADNDLSVAPVDAEPLVMIHPDDVIVNGEFMTADNPPVTCADDTLPDPRVKDAKRKKVCENENAIKKSKKKTNKMKKMDFSQTEKEKCDMDVSLPPLVVEESCKKTNNDSLVSVDLDNLKGAMKDITNTTNDISYADEPENLAVVRSIHFESLDSTSSRVGLSETTQYKKEKEGISEQVEMQESNCIAPQNSLNDIYTQNESTSDIGNQVIFDMRNYSDFNPSRKLQSPPDKSEMVMQANVESFLQSDCSNDSDSEISVCSIIVSTRKSRGSQLSSSVSIDNIGEMFDNYNSGSDSCVNSSIVSSKRMYGYPERSLFNANLDRISEESVQRSVHSTPKSGVSFNCTKYLDARISPLRLPASLRPDSIRKPEYMECGDGSLLEHASSFKKKVVVPAKRVVQPSIKLGGRSKESAHSISCASTQSNSTTEQSVKSTPSKRKISRSVLPRCGTSFSIPKSESEKKYTELGCCIRTTLDVWCTQLSTMEQHLERFKKEIDTFKQGLFNDCCVRHRKNE